MNTVIEISNQLREILNRNNVLIRSLSLLSEDFRRRFVNERKKAVLLVRSKMFEREISEAGRNEIDIFDETLIPLLQKGERIIVVFPTDSKKRFVLQTEVEQLFVDRFRLRALDPRMNQRFVVKDVHPVRCRLVPETVLFRLQNGEFALHRQTEGLAPDPSYGDSLGSKAASKGEKANYSTGKAEVVDSIVKSTDHEVADDNKHLLAIPHLSGILKNISAGGMCLLLEKSWDANASDRLILLDTDITYDKYDSDDKPKENAPVTLQTYACVRNVQNIDNGILLHLMFLASLPRDINRYFPVLKGGFRDD